MPIALTIAGVDPSGGAGVLADVRTFAEFECFPTAVITSLTFQNTAGVFGAVNQTGQTIRHQLLPLIRDFTIAAVKTGMLPNREVISEVAAIFREELLPRPVIDPVMQATSGDPLIDEKAISSLINELFPLAQLVTPNIPEAERLVGFSIKTESEMVKAAAAIRALGPRAVLLKGGHLINSPEAIDVLDDSGQVSVLREAMLPIAAVHGSGCTLSAAITAGLAKGYDLKRAVIEGKHYVTSAIKSAPHLGHGAIPLFKGETKR